MGITHDFSTFVASLDIAHVAWGFMRSAQFGMRRRRKHHKITNELRGVTSIEFLDNAQSGFNTLDMLKKYGVPAWSGAVLGRDEDTGATALRMHLPASQEAWARYLLKRAGVTLLDKHGAPVDALRSMPVSWADRLRGETKVQQTQRMQPAREQQQAPQPKRQRSGFFDL